jgi:hypothetical protein
MYLFYILLGIPVFSLLLGFTPTDPKHIFKTRVCEDRVRVIFGNINEYKAHPFKVKNLKISKHLEYHVYNDEFNSNLQALLEKNDEGYSSSIKKKGRFIASNFNSPENFSKDFPQYQLAFSKYKDLIQNVTIIEFDSKIQSVNFQDKVYCEFNGATKCICP